MKKKILLLMVVLIVAITASVTLVGCDLFDNFTSKDPSIINNNYNITVTDSVMAERYVLEEIRQSCVLVQSTVTYGMGSRVVSNGSGTIITDEGHIITNYHVIGAEKANISKMEVVVTVNNADGTTTLYSAEIIGTPTLYPDIAIIKIKNGKSFKPISFAKHSSVKLGESAIIYGNSASTGFTASRAMVSDPNGVENGDSKLQNYDSLIKLDAPVNPGNSGGGVFNMKGDFIGMVTYRKETVGTDKSAVLNIGYAINNIDILDAMKSKYTVIFDKLIVETYDDVLDVKVDAA